MLFRRRRSRREPGLLAAGPWSVEDGLAEFRRLGGPGPENDPGTGLDLEGWEASIWILHTMYESTRGPVDLTHDDLDRLHPREPRSPVAELEALLGEATTLTGIPGGLIEAPGEDWQRLRWHELAARLGHSLDGNDVPPCFRWFPYKSWPASIQPPSEGSLDSESLASLTEQLKAVTPAGMCFASYGLVAAGANEEVPRCFYGPLDAIDVLVDPSMGRHGTPSNFWPDDRSWFVYTDWDLMGTKVSGSRRLIEALSSHPDLETIVWRPPPTGDPTG